MASAELSRRAEKVVAYPPLCELGDQQRRELHEALLEADSFEDLPGKWQAAILQAEQKQPELRVVRDDWSGVAPLRWNDMAEHGRSWETRDASRDG